MLNDANETEVLALIMSKHLVGGDLIILTGELGVGKSVFARALLKSMGVEGTVSSPTFVLVKNYEGMVPIDHVDIYRVDDVEELDILCIGELLDEGHLVVMEWGERALGLFGDSYLQTTFERLDSEISLENEIEGKAQRFVTVELVGPKFVKRRSQIETEISLRWSAL